MCMCVNVVLVHKHVYVLIHHEPIYSLADGVLPSTNSETLFFQTGLSSPPANITTSAVPSIVTPIVNGFTGIPHQPNGHPAVETVYTNGLPPYSTQSPTAADTLQQAFTGVQQYTGGTQQNLVSAARNGLYIFRLCRAAP